MTTKGVSVIASVPGSVLVETAIELNQTQDPVVIQGLHMAPTLAGEAILEVRVDSPLAPVWIEGVEPAPATFPPNYVRYRLSHDDNLHLAPAMVTLKNCVTSFAVSGAPWPFSESPRVGLLQEGGRATAIGCTFWGQRGNSATLVDIGLTVSARRGAAGVRQSSTLAPVTGAELNLFDCDVQGGRGGSGESVCFSFGCSCYNEEAGGDAIRPLGPSDRHPPPARLGAHARRGGGILIRSARPREP